MSDWANLSDDIEQERLCKGPKCSVHRLLEEEIPEGDREEVRGVIENPDVQITALRRALMKRIGDAKTPQPSSISRHRRGDCACRREG